MDGDTYALLTRTGRPAHRPTFDGGVIDARGRIARVRDRRGREPGRYRVVLYSHDSMGLGHVRRNLLLAQILSEADLEIDVLLITGAREAGGFSLPPGVDLVVLPALHKAVDGSYGARNLGVELDALSAIRSRLVCATIESFEPDLVIVDNVARGVNGELDAALRYIRDRGHIRCVLGLRDIQDEAEQLRREWESRRCLETIREYYDAVWVYGDADVFDPREEYNLPADIAYKLQFTGYLDPCLRLDDTAGADREAELPDRPFGLCQVGGGQDGAALALAFAHARHPANMDAVVITGPYIDADCLARLKLLAKRRPNLRVLQFVREPTRILRAAEYVVCMGGYNTICEVAAFDKPALVVPRIVPRREQIVRAERLQALGVFDMLHPDSLSADSLSQWIAGMPRGRGVSARRLFDMNAAQRIPEYFLDQVRRSRGRPDREPRQAEL